MSTESKYLTKQITYFFEPVTLACDGNCDKAWGINNRPQIQLGDDPDDYVYLADDELGTAPRDPGTWEGGHGKPYKGFKWGKLDRQNKWCTRECERSGMFKAGEEIRPPDCTKRIYNLHSRRAEAEAASRGEQ